MYDIVNGIMGDNFNSDENIRILFFTDLFFHKLISN